MTDIVTSGNDDDIQERLDDIKFIRELAKELAENSTSIGNLICCYSKNGAVNELSIGHLTACIGLAEYSKSNCLKRLSGDD